MSKPPKHETRRERARRLVRRLNRSRRGKRPSVHLAADLLISAEITAGEGRRGR